MENMEKKIKLEPLAQESVNQQKYYTYNTYINI